MTYDSFWVRSVEGRARIATQWELVHLIPCSIHVLWCVWMLPHPGYSNITRWHNLLAQKTGVRCLPIYTARVHGSQILNLAKGKKNRSTLSITRLFFPCSNQPEFLRKEPRNWPRPRRKTKHLEQHPTPLISQRCLMCQNHHLSPILMLVSLPLPSFVNFLVNFLAHRWLRALVFLT